MALTYRKSKYSSYGVFINHVRTFQFWWFSCLTYQKEIVLVKEGMRPAWGNCPWGKVFGGDCPTPWCCDHAVVNPGSLGIPYTSER